MKWLKENYAALGLFLLQIFAHLGLIYGIFYFTLVDWLIVLMVYFVTGCLGVSTTFHRFLSHKAFKLYPFSEWETYGTLFGTYGLVGSSLAWVNNHRAHHRYTDEQMDPHSPHYLGFWRVQFLSMFYSERNMIYVKDLLRKPLHVFLHKYYFVIHGAIIFLWLLTGQYHLMAVFYLAPAAILWNAGSLINNLGHLKLVSSYRNFETDDHSQNNPYLGLGVWGEGYHNNHHAAPASASFSTHPAEFDISYYIIDKYLRDEQNIQT